MVDLLKAFGRGILYVIAFPFFLVVLAVFAVIGLLAFIFQLVKSIIFFFTGQKFFPELPEDKELRLMREAEEAKNNPIPEEEPAANQNISDLLKEPAHEKEPTPDIITPIPTPAPVPRTIEEACFQDMFEEKPVLEEANMAPISEPEPEPEPEIEVEEPIEEEPEVIPEPESAPLLEEDPTEDPLDDFLSALEEEEPVQEENLETYKPRGSEESFEVEEDKDDSHMGVDINFDD